MAMSALRTALRQYHSKSMIDDVLMTNRTKGWDKMTEQEKGAYNMLYELYDDNKELRTYEDQFFYAVGKYPELDEAFKAGRLYEDDVMAAFDKKLMGTVDNYIERLRKINENPNKGSDDAYTIIEELLDDDLLELVRERKSLNDMTGAWENGVDPAGKLDVLTEALRGLQFDSTPESALHNLQGIKAHINTLPEAQINLAKTKGTMEDYDFWDGDNNSVFELSGGEGDNTRRNALSESYDNVVKEGQYTPTEPGPRDWSMLDAAAQRRKEIKMEADTAPEMMQQSWSDPESYAKGEEIIKKTEAETEAIMAEIERLKRQKDGGIIRASGGGFIDGPLYDND